MKRLLGIFVLIAVAGCTPYTAEEIAELEARNPSQKFMGYGDVCGFAGRGMVCNNSGR